MRTIVHILTGLAIMAVTVVWSYILVNSGIMLYKAWGPLSLLIIVPALLLCAKGIGSGFLWSDPPPASDPKEKEER